MKCEGETTFTPSEVTRRRLTLRPHPKTKYSVNEVTNPAGGRAGGCVREGDRASERKRRRGRLGVPGV